MSAQKIISSRAELKPVLEHDLAIYKKEGPEALVELIHKDILKKKVRYPILEFAAAEFYRNIDSTEQVDLTDKIVALNENGSDVIAGKMLQLRLPKYFEESVHKAIEYIIRGNSWLSCDTLGERVFGHALLTMPEKTIPTLQKLATHEDKWIVRSIGVATHYAVKKGLKKQFAEEMFILLLSLSHTTDFHTKKGIGWAAKTIAKFHPDIISKYGTRINEDPGIRQWFKTKIRIGLGRAEKYAHRYTG